MKKLQTTVQRTAIMAYLEGNKSHPSANDVYKAVAQQLTGISLTTVLWMQITQFFQLLRE